MFFLALFKKICRKISKLFKILANKNAIKFLRGVIFGKFSDDSNTRKLPENYPDPALKKKIYPDPARTRRFGTRTRPGPGNFGLVHTLLAHQNNVQV